MLIDIEIFQAGFPRLKPEDVPLNCFPNTALAYVELIDLFQLFNCKLGANIFSSDLLNCVSSHLTDSSRSIFFAWGFYSTLEGASEVTKFRLAEQGLLGPEIGDLVPRVGLVMVPKDLRSFPRAISSCVSGPFSDVAQLSITDEIVKRFEQL